MATQIVPEQLLRSSKKILFITHLAIGDFTYLQNFFRAFALAYPHLKIDLWIDERRRTWCFWRWKYLKKYALFDWVKTCPFFNKIYSETYSLHHTRRSVKKAQQERYDIIVSLAILNKCTYIRLARKINKRAFIVAHKPTNHVYNPFKRLLIKKTQGLFSYSAQPNDHITDVYATWFEQIFGLRLEKNHQKPFVTIPRVWILHAKLQLLKWGVDRRCNHFTRIVFINVYAKDKKRSWPLQNAFELVRILKQNDPWQDTTYIINAPPENAKAALKMANLYGLTQTHVVSATLNFFQLPAFISISNLVISVETSVMHLAAALDVPTVALMRIKNPEWHPWDTGNISIVPCSQRSHWVRNISLEDVANVVTTHSALNPNSASPDL